MSLHLANMMSSTAVSRKSSVTWKRAARILPHDGRVNGACRRQNEAPKAARAPATAVVVTPAASDSVSSSNDASCGDTATHTKALVTSVPLSSTPARATRSHKTGEGKKKKKTKQNRKTSPDKMTVVPFSTRAKVALMSPSRRTANKVGSSAGDTKDGVRTSSGSDSSGSRRRVDASILRHYIRPLPPQSSRQSTSGKERPSSKLEPCDSLGRSASTICARQGAISSPTDGVTTHSGSDSSGTRRRVNATILRRYIRPIPLPCNQQSTRGKERHSIKLEPSDRLGCSAMKARPRNGAQRSGSNRQTRLLPLCPSAHPQYGGFFVF